MKSLYLFNMKNMHKFLYPTASSSLPILIFLHTWCKNFYIVLSLCYFTWKSMAALRGKKSSQILHTNEMASRASLKFQGYSMKSFHFSKGNAWDTPTRIGLQWSEAPSLLLQGIPPFPFPHFHRFENPTGYYKSGRKSPAPFGLIRSCTLCKPFLSVSLGKVTTLPNWAVSHGLCQPVTRMIYSKLLGYSPVSAVLANDTLITKTKGQFSALVVLVISSTGHSRSLLPPRRTFSFWFAGCWPLLVFLPLHWSLLC